MMVGFLYAAFWTCLYTLDYDNWIVSKQFFFEAMKSFLFVDLEDRLIFIMWNRALEI